MDSEQIWVLNQVELAALREVAIARNVAIDKAVGLHI